MHKTTHRLAVTAGAITIGLALAGCSTGGGETDAATEWSIPAEDPTATVTVVSIAGLGDDTDGMQHVIDAFEDDHPTITIDWQTVPGDQLSSVLETRLGNKESTLDLYWADQPRIPALASRGYALDISDQFGELSDAWQPPATEGSSFDGKLYGAPLATSTQLLYYNKALLEKAGLDAPSADPESRVTWEQLTDDAKKAQDAGASYGLTFGQVNTYYQLEPLPVSKGGGPGAEGEGNLTPQLTDQGWKDAMTWYGSLFADGVAPRGVTDNASDFLAGKTAYFVEGNWMIDRLAAQNDIDWGVAAHPKFADGDAVTPTGSWSMAMNPFSANKEAAAIFMKWMTVDDGGNYSRYRPAPELPANPEGLTAYLEKDVFQTDEGKKAASLIEYETVNTGVPRLQTVGYLEFESIIGSAFSDISNGSDPAATLQNASTELEKAWAKYRK